MSISIKRYEVIFTIERPWARSSGSVLTTAWVRRCIISPSHIYQYLLCAPLRLHKTMVMMGYRRASWPLKTITGASLIIFLWFISNSIPRCIHCTDGLSEAHLVPGPIKPNACSNIPVPNDNSSVPPTHKATPQRPIIAKPHPKSARPNLPQDYLLTTEESIFCENRFGTKYLETLRDSATAYCTADSPSDITCFHSQTTKGYVDSLCIARNAIFDPATAKFRLGCDLGMLLDSHQPFLVPEYGTFQKYMFDTGPRVIMDNWIELDDTVELNEPETPKYTILVKREGSSNIWHSLLEIFSMSLTLDVLQMSQSSDSKPFFTTPDTLNTQVVLLDDHADGPLFDLWSIFAKRPIRRLKDLPPNTSFENIILPLAGGSNPLWQVNPPREGASCENSALLRTFSRRVMDHYGIPPQRPRLGDDITITFIDRKDNRVLLNHTEYLEDVKSSFPSITIQEVDFAAISFKEQLDILQQTDILVGVHGAGLTHAMFLPPRSTVVEIFPAQVDFRVFENLASLLDHSYFSVRSSKGSDTSSRVDWHQQPVSLDKERFTDVLGIALKALYNKIARIRDN